MRGKLMVVVVLLVPGMLLAFASSSAVAAGPVAAWGVQSVAVPTSFSASVGTTSYTVGVTNVGSRASSGVYTLVDRLPAGLTAAGASWSGTNSFRGDESEEGVCTVEEAGTVVRCTREESVPALTPALRVIGISVTVNPGVEGTKVNHVEISGGGATATATADTPTVVTQGSLAEPLRFGLSEFGLSLPGADGAPDTRAGGHPGGLSTALAFNSAWQLPQASGKHVSSYPVQQVKQIVTELPAGVVGDALATPTCPLYLVTNKAGDTSVCPAATQVGWLTLLESPEEAPNTDLGIYNVTPEHGFAAEFAVYLRSLQRAENLYAKVVGSGPDTRVLVFSQPQDRVPEISAVSATFFGDPAVADSSPLAQVPFLTEPSDCSASGFTGRIYVDSWEEPARSEPDGLPVDLSEPQWKKAESSLPPVTGCEALQFHPSLTFAPEAAHRQADEPAGYESVLQIPQSEDPNVPATPPLKNTVVTLPAGVAVSPSAANGLVGCELSAAELDSSRPGHCPTASKVGEVEALTPVLEEPLKGGVYVEQPPCGAGGAACTEAQAERGEVFGLYLELANENRGVYVKVRGNVEVGGAGQYSREAGLQPGQIRTTFAETPQQPVSELKLRFNNGPRAPLANPQTCGVFTTIASLEPWSAPYSGPNAIQQPAFAIGGCENRFSPAFSAGTINSQAGAYSPFTATFARHDGEQDLSGITLNEPAGLSAKIAGIPQCPEAAANAGTCSAASRIGTAAAAAGSGTEPFWQSGNVYLTGPYHGAPYGLSVVVPAKAGPYNLGNIVVRAAITINPYTAAASVTSNPLPQSVDGVPLRVQTVNVTVGQENNFTFNATNCSPASVTATLTSAQGATAQVANPYEPASCASMKFAPKLSASTSGKASKAGGASLDVKVSYPAGAAGTYANIKTTKVFLPKQLPSRLTTLQKACLAATFEANPASCPAASDVGTATANTPLLNVPLSGPAYLVSHGGAAFPDLEVVLQGENVTIILDGKTDIKKGITSSTFNTIPDAPVSSFELKLPTGKYSILATNIPEKLQYNLCGQTLTMPTLITGQNGATINQTTKITTTGCPKAKHTKPHKKAKKAAKPNPRSK
jgi:hypothetical protein